MILKRPLCTHRLRSLPPSGFGWIDHRLLREGYFQRCTPASLALYSLLVCASDSQGLSFYSDARAAELLGLQPGELRAAREVLVVAQLIAFQKPVYQVLRLDAAQNPPRIGSCVRQLPRGAAVSSPQPSSPNSPLPPPPPHAQPCQFVPAPRGLNLQAMVEASLQKGGAQ